MNTYTVSFFGHREMNNHSEVEIKLEKIIRNIIERKEYVEFLVGREGEFDQLVSSIIRRISAIYSYGNSSHVLVLPYMKAEYRDNQHSFLDYYDEVEVCAESSAAHYKSAILVRNMQMVDRSDLIICYIKHNSGGAYKAVRYAKNNGVEIYNLADDCITEL